MTCKQGDLGTPPNVTFILRTRGEATKSARSSFKITRRNVDVGSSGKEAIRCRNANLDYVWVSPDGFNFERRVFERHLIGPRVKNQGARRLRVGSNATPTMTESCGA